MDLNELRTVITVVSLLTFSGIVLWAYGRGRKNAFDEAANLPFSEEEFPAGQSGAPKTGVQSAVEKEGNAS